MHREVRDKTDELSDLCCKLLKLKVKTEEIATIGMFVRDDTREKQDK
jgi:hypothetical protein